MAIQAANLYATVSVAGAERSVGQLQRVSGQVDRTQGTLSRLSANGAQVGRGLGQVAGGLTRIGTVAAVAAVGAGAAAAGMAISFEDAFANVRKTVEGTETELDRIDQGLRKLSTDIPVTYQALAGIATEAGALGVATEHVNAFTEAVARTSAATVGLSPEAAADAFGRLSTVFGLTGDLVRSTTGAMISDYDRLGSALVALGNAGASSEADIIQTAKYLAGAGQAAGLSADQVLAWSSAVTSLGMAPEAAGGALSRVFQRLTTNIATGSGAVKNWAKVAGMSVKDFVKFYGEDATGAVMTFLEGLQELDKFDQAKMLQKAGIINQRDISAITRMSENLPVVIAQLKISADAWADGNELMVVSERRFDTLLSKITELTNTIKVGAAAVGEGMTPAIGRLVEKAKDFTLSHMGDLKKLGKDIGQAIDDINWSAVAQGARDFVGLLRSGLEILRQIPPEFLAMSAGFIGLNRISGGLLGAGLMNIGSGLAKGAGNIFLAALSRLPGLGGRAGAVLGAVTAQRVFVVNWPIGMGAGGLAGAAGAAGGGFMGGRLGKWGGLLGGLFTLGSSVVLTEALNKTWNEGILPGLQAQAQTNANNLSAILARNNPTEMASALEGLRNLPATLNPIQRLLYDLNASGVKVDTERLITALEDAIAREAEPSTYGPYDGPAPHRKLRKYQRRVEENRNDVDWNLFPDAPTDTSTTRAEGIRGAVDWGSFESNIASIKDRANMPKPVPIDSGTRQQFEAQQSVTRHVSVEVALTRLATYGVTAAINALPGNLRSLLRPRVVVRPGDSGADGGTGGLVYTGARPYARGGVGLAKSPHQAIFGEAENEAVAIIRNPREFEGMGGQIIIQPQPLRLVLNGRDLVNAMVPYDETPRRLA